MLLEQTKEVVKNKEMGRAASWVNRVISQLVSDYVSDTNVLPKDFVLDGVNIVRLHNGKISVGFVFGKEATDGTR